MTPEELLAVIVTRWREFLPLDVPRAYFDRFVRRRRAELLRIVGAFALRRRWQAIGRKLARVADEQWIERGQTFEDRFSIDPIALADEASVLAGCEPSGDDLAAVIDGFQKEVQALRVPDLAADLAAIDLSRLPGTWREELFALDQIASGEWPARAVKRRLMARGVLDDRATMPTIVGDRPVEWTITPGLNLRVRGRDYAAGPRHELERLGRVLHRLGYPEPAPVYAAFGVGRPFSLRSPAALGRMVREMTARGVDPTTQVPAAWVKAVAEGSAPLAPALPPELQRLVAELAAEGVPSSAVIRPLGLAPAQWDRYARPPSVEMTELRRSLLEALPATADAITLDLPADLDQAALVNRLLKTYEGLGLVEASDGDEPVWSRTERGDQRLRDPAPGPTLVWTPGSATGRAAQKAEHSGEGNTGRYLVRPDPRRGLRVEWQPRGDGDPLLLGRVRRPIDGRRLAEEHYRDREAAKAGLDRNTPPPAEPVALGAWLAQEAITRDASLALGRSQLRDRLAGLGSAVDDETIARAIRGYTDEAARLLPVEADRVFRPRPGGDDDDRIVVRPRVMCRRCGVELAEPGEHVAIWADGKAVVCPVSDDFIEIVAEVEGMHSSEAEETTEQGDRT